ncbi:sensor histidine kinase [Parafrankia sp. BMG5.11]|uniref:sensor histidine kinase n=2 Tax=Frankiaceae TaxID=74712 RepID=UPI000DA51086|nr:histidine kinase [Parafrankia sp. BMG5.11]CAI7979976.1 Integral membrane sensor signal transduction histidine kinase [Frankia sp. Hr75.2]SQD94230.1 Integral membrane sensor signal transduction histidine kinase [Parafrankia sp. Ea1.12]
MSSGKVSTMASARVPGPVAPPVVIGLAAGAVVLLIWAAVGGGYFWPRWVWFGIGTVFWAAILVGWVRRIPPGRRRWLAATRAVAALAIPVDVVVWALSGGGYFWPVWTILALTIGLAIHTWIVALMPAERERELTERVDALTRTRRGALDGQAAELKRIERDLHDGAQARIVSLAMNLGMAEALLHSDPAAAAKLLSDARLSAVGALDDLRAVMHSIHPSVLADRGLAGGIRALALDLSLPVRVDGDVPSGLPAAVESAVYFATAECLANVVKHSRAAHGAVRFAHDGRMLSVVVTDDGLGGADPALGQGLRGVVRRLEAFDGRMSVHSPSGGPTRITITLPCPVLPGAET